MLNARKATRITPHVASPTAVPTTRIPVSSTSSAHFPTSRNPALLPRNFKKAPIEIDRQVGHWTRTTDGREIFDASGGAAVSNFGPGEIPRIKAAADQASARYGPYQCGLSYDTEPVQQLADALVRSTDGIMESVAFYGSGSDAVEAGFKLLLQYWQDVGQPERQIFVAREQSYHGTTLASLSLGSYWSRRDPFEDLLMDVHHVPACSPYRGKKEGQSDKDYVKHLQDQLRRKFEELGHGKVAGFVCEPIVGAALGCVPALPGYLKAMQEVCDDFDVPLMLDEIMCGWGRCGTLHAWQDEGVIPDVQLIGKGFAGGHEQISAMLIGRRRGIVDTIRDTSIIFNHGHTFQNPAKCCAAALETMKMVQEYLPNVRAMGELLMKRLKARLSAHVNVGDIRGKGLFVGIEFVQDELSKTAFDPQDAISAKIHEMGLTHAFQIHVYPGSGSANPHGKEGDHIILAPPFDINEDEVNLIVDRVGALVDHFFKEQNLAIQQS
ncbi:PLP-dependent transferase [Bimuria novae-zelandiae CBS 107.79]|uniref:PLP-dependent transferase n=1 Tax=Bimuria novae-zelandiae CBS 107.79 TaxID=1447943 RepID=A0A6A5VRP3_9PLEO|nr:PLP-dependent transferase [Bimuria novae-zelandiae CBS 107.79]